MGLSVVVCEVVVVVYVGGGVKGRFEWGEDPVIGVFDRKDVLTCVKFEDHYMRWRVFRPRRWRPVSRMERVLEQRMRRRDWVG